MKIRVKMSSLAESDQRLWSDLPIDLLCLIVARLTNTLDVSNFALICPQWAVAAVTSIHHPSKQFPWLLLCTEDSCRFDCRYNRIFLSPSFCGHRFVGSGSGWLVMISVDQKITLLNPLSGAQIQLPRQSTLKIHPAQSTLKIHRERMHWVESPKEKFKSYIHKIAVHKDNSGDLVAVAIAGVGKKLAIARPSDRAWTSIGIRWSPFDDVILRDGRIYAISHGGTVVSYNINNPKSPAEVIAHTHGGPRDRFGSSVHRYIVFSSTTGCLLQLVRSYRNEDWERGFKVYELQREPIRWRRIYKLGDEALFVGLNTSSSVKAPCNRGCDTGTISFTEDCIDDYYRRRDGYVRGRGMRTFGDEYFLSGRYYSGHYMIGCIKKDMPQYPPLWFIPELP